MPSRKKNAKKTPKNRRILFFDIHIYDPGSRDCGKLWEDGLAKQISERKPTRQVNIVRYKLLDWIPIHLDWQCGYLSLALYIHLDGLREFKDVRDLIKKPAEGWTELIQQVDSFCPASSENISLYEIGNDFLSELKHQYGDPNSETLKLFLMKLGRSLFWNRFCCPFRLSIVAQIFMIFARFDYHVLLLYLNFFGRKFSKHVL